MVFGSWTSSDEAGSCCAWEKHNHKFLHDILDDFWTYLQSPFMDIVVGRILRWSSRILTSGVHTLYNPLCEYDRISLSWLGCIILQRWKNFADEIKAPNQLTPTLCNPTDCSPPGSSVHGNSPGKNTGVGSHSGWDNPLEEAWQPTPVFLPGESHGQRSLVGYSP